jgi:hypothetical protein
MLDIEWIKTGYTKVSKIEVSLQISQNPPI